MKYSKHDLLSEEYQRVNDSWLDKIQNKIYDMMFSSVIMELKIPSVILFRAEVISEDIASLSGIDFTVVSLLEILYEDFLNYIKGNSDIYSIYRMLQSASTELTIKKHNEGVVVHTSYQAMKTFKIAIKRKKVLRAEVYLNDLSNVIPDHEMTVEKILEIILIDFVNRHTSGRYPNLLKDLIDRLDE